MKVKIGTGEFKLREWYGSILGDHIDFFLEQAGTRLIQRWNCGPNPSDPSPLQTTIDSETNILVFSPLDKGKSPIDLYYAPSRRQNQEMTKVAKKFLKRAGLSDPNMINKAVQDALGSYSFPIPWKDIRATWGDSYSVNVISAVHYRVFALPQVRFQEAEMLISLPYRAVHSTRRMQRCDDSGKLVHSAGYFFEKTVFGVPAHPKTDAARRLRKECANSDRLRMEKRIKDLKKTLKELETEEQALKKE